MSVRRSLNPSNIMSSMSFFHPGELRPSFRCFFIHVIFHRHVGNGLDVVALGKHDALVSSIGCPSSPTRAMVCFCFSEMSFSNISLRNIAVFGVASQRHTFASPNILRARCPKNLHDYPPFLPRRLIASIHRPAGIRRYMAGSDGSGT